MKRTIKRKPSRLAVVALCACLFFGIAMLQACAAEPAPEERAASRVTVSGALTAEELVQRYAESAGISYGEALACFPEEVKAARSAADAAYCVVSVPLEVAGNYIPTLELYCKAELAQGQMGITEICSIQMNRTCTAAGQTISKVFAGDVQAWLREENQIEYAVNGDFYEDGEDACVAIAGGAANGGASASFRFTLPDSYAGEHEQYFYEHQTAAADEK